MQGLIYVWYSGNSYWCGVDEFKGGCIAYTCQKPACEKLGRFNSILKEKGDKSLLIPLELL